MLLEKAKHSSQEEGAVFERLSSAAKTVAESRAEVRDTCHLPKEYI